jgi:hypothetical protein
MTASSAFLESLRTAARDAEIAETAYRREAAARIAALEADRAVAYRRMNLLQAVGDAVARAESEEIAVASALATLAARLGWTGDSEERSAVLTRFAPIAQALYRALGSEGGAEEADIASALAVFELWYAETHDRAFWTLFAREMPETPVVDF